MNLPVSPVALALQVASANGFERLGVTRESLQPETRLVVTGDRESSGRNITAAVKLRLKDGRREVAMPIFLAGGSDIRHVAR